MQPLAIDVSQFGAAQMHHESIRAALARGLPELSPAICSHDGTVVLVGSGPSAPQFLDEIREQRALGRPIVAVKGAHDLLCENGIIPDLFISIEPRDRRNNIKHANDETIYLLASRCAPEVFDHLKDRKVMLFHALGHPEENKVFENTGKSLLLGGSTSGLRAIFVMYWLGFRKFILYGYDSCLNDAGDKRFDGSKAGQTVDIIVSGRRFLANHAMAAQAQEFQTIFQVLPEAQLDIRGDGLLAWIHQERKKRILQRQAA